MSGADPFAVTRSSQWLKPGDTGEATVVFQMTLVIAAGEQGES
jgi:hypothetical protein